MALKAKRRPVDEPMKTLFSKITGDAVNVPPPGTATSNFTFSVFTAYGSASGEVCVCRALRRPLWRNAGQSAEQALSGSPSHATDRKSTRLNSSHGYISYAVFCLKKKKN